MLRKIPSSHEHVDVIPNQKPLKKNITNLKKWNPSDSTYESVHCKNASEHE